MAASSWQKIIFISLILTIAFPVAMSHREKSDDDDDSSDRNSDTKRYLKDLCSEAKDSKACWKIIKHNLNRFTDTDTRNVAGAVFDLAIDKSNEIHDKLNKLYEDSHDDALKEKYISCSKNYKDANRDLQVAKGNLDTDEYRNIPVQIDDVAEELESCRREFDGDDSSDDNDNDSISDDNDKDSSERGHIRKRNKEFGHYVDIVKVATNRLVKQRDGDK